MSKIDIKLERKGKYVRINMLNIESGQIVDRIVSKDRSLIELHLEQMIKEILDKDIDRVIYSI